MRHILLLFTLLAFSQLSAQFRTQRSHNGDPLTEIIDPSQMRQGKWNYYDEKDRVIRNEVYLDHVLISRTLPGTKRILSAIDLEEIQAALPQPLAGRFHGEIHIDGRGRFGTIHFYEKPAQQDLKNLTSLKKYLKSVAANHTNKIVVFK